MDTEKKYTRYKRFQKTQPYRKVKQQPGRIRRKHRRRIRKSKIVSGAENRLKGFRQASVLAVAMTGFFLLLFSAGETFSSGQQNDTILQDTAIIESIPDTLVQVVSTEQAAGEAIGELQNIWASFKINYPKVLIAFAVLFISWLLVRALKFILLRIFRRSKSREGIVTLVAIAVWILAAGLAISVVAGDIRALVGSFGLIGLALSWALQTPIESFTGWLLNVFRRYYRVGDRILVGDVFGDVFRIDFLSTTVWEIGSPYQPGFVSAEQPTGRLVTFPNNEILTGTVINLTGDFPYVWDELEVYVANESDLNLAMAALKSTAQKVVGDYMKQPAKLYRNILHRAGITDAIPEHPEIFLSSGDTWTSIIIRYLIGARERRKWKTELLLKVTEELNNPRYKGKIINVYPRRQIQIINNNGIPVKVPGSGSTDED